MSDTLCKHGWSLRFCEPCSTAAFMASVKGPGDGGMLATQRELTALRAENEKLSAALRAWDDAVKIHVTMEGPHYAGMSSELAKKAWGKTRAALGDTHE